MSDHIYVEWEVFDKEIIRINKDDIENSRTVQQAMDMIIDIIDQVMPRDIHIKLVNEGEIMEFINEERSEREPKSE